MLAFGEPTTLDGEDATELVVVIEDGRAGVGPVTVYLRGVQRNSLPYADTEAQHIAFTMPSCMLTTKSVGGEEDNEQEMEITVEPSAAENGDPLFALSIATSIPS